MVWSRPFFCRSAGILQYDTPVGVPLGSDRSEIIPTDREDLESHSCSLLSSLSPRFVPLYLPGLVGLHRMIRSLPLASGAEGFFQNGSNPVGDTFSLAPSVLLCEHVPSRKARRPRALCHLAGSCLRCKLRTVHAKSGQYDGTTGDTTVPREHRGKHPGDLPLASPHLLCEHGLQKHPSGDVRPRFPE